MKKLLLVILFNLSLNIVSDGQNSLSEYLEIMKDKVIESYSIDLNDDEMLDEISLMFPANSEHPDFGYGDPGVFNILKIKLANGEAFILENAFDSLALPIRENSENKIQSNLIYLTEPINCSKYLLICGPGYGCCFPKLFILKILENSVELIYVEEFEISDFTYNNEIENIYFTGRTYWGEAWGGYKTQFEFNSFSYPKVYKIAEGLTVDQKATYQLNKNEIDKYGDFLSYSYPVFIINKETDERFLVDFTDEIENQYQLKYYDLSGSELSENYFRGFNKAELRLMRNEIFASYGYIFSTPDLKEYFEKKKWYKPRYKNVNDKLTEIEKYNINLILSIENSQ